MVITDLHAAVQSLLLSSTIMQYFSKVALLVVALFGTSVLALPLAPGYDLEAREFNNDLSSREFYGMYLEARDNPTLDARDLESLDLEARELIRVSLFGLKIKFLFLIKGMTLELPSLF